MVNKWKYLILFIMSIVKISIVKIFLMLYREVKFIGFLNRILNDVIV